MEGYVLTERFASVLTDKYTHIVHHQDAQRCLQNMLSEKEVLNAAHVHTQLVNTLKTAPSHALQSEDAPDCVKQALKSSLPNGGIREKERGGGEEEAVSLAGRKP